MARNCLTDISASNVLVSCSVPSHGVKNIYLMPIDGVTLTRSSAGVITAATFASGYRSYMVEGYKQNIQVTTAIRSLDASSKLDISVMFKVPHSVSGALTGTDLAGALLTRKWFVLVEMNDSSKFIVGDISPLECSGFDWDSNANGLLRTVTLTAPEGSYGNYIREISAAAANTIISKAV